MRLKLEGRSGQPNKVLISMFMGLTAFSLECFVIFLSLLGFFDLLFLWVFVSVSAAKFGLRLRVVEDARRRYESL